MTKDYFKRLNVVNYTEWDLNCRSIVRHTKGRNRLERMFHRHARRKDKKNLKKVLDNLD